MSSPEKWERKRKPAKRFDEETYPAGAPRRKGKGTSGIPPGHYVEHSEPDTTSCPQQSFLFAPARPRAGGPGGVMVGGSLGVGELDSVAGAMVGPASGGEAVAGKTNGATETTPVTGGRSGGSRKEGENGVSPAKSRLPDTINTANTKDTGNVMDNSNRKDTENVQDGVALSLLASHVDPTQQLHQQQLQHAAAVLQAQQERKCNCKNSKCLKLYCECFASGRYCDGCNCQNCHNKKEREDVRQVAVASVLERNPNAFRPKVQATKGTEEGMVVDVKHDRGCNCRKSNCLKKYCECFQAGVLCTENCRCQGCKNFQSSGYRTAPAEPEEKMQIRSSTRRKRPPVNRDVSQMEVPLSKQRGPQPPGAPYSSRPYQSLHEPAFDHAGPPESLLPDVLRQSYSPRPPTLALTAEQIKTITSMCLSDVINPTVLKQTCMLITLLADENLKALTEQDTTAGTTLEEKVEEVCAQQKLAIDEEFVATSQKIIATITTKLEARRDRFQKHQNTVYGKFVSPQKPRRWGKDPDPDPGCEGGEQV